MSLAPNMTGADMYAAMSTLIDGFNMDSTLFYQLLNAERAKIEFMRPWVFLRKTDNSNVSTPATFSLVAPPTTNKLTLPTDFSFLSRDGEITLYDQNNQWEDYTEIPMERMVQFLQVNNSFFIDYVNLTLTLLGNVTKAYNVFIPYQADFGDITATTTWNNVPARFHLLLPLAVAIRYRMGIDYDDINSRNAQDNKIAYDELLNAMKVLDDNRQRSSTTKRNLPDVTNEAGSNFNRRINI